MRSLRTATSIITVAVLGAALGAAGCLEDSPAPDLGTAAEELTANATFQRGTFGTVADTFISAADMKKNHGGQKKLRVSKKNEALIRFDLASIPANAVINKAELTLFINGGDDEDDDDCDDGDHEGHPIAPLKLHRVTHAWAENTVTYKNFNQQFAPAVVGTIVLSNRSSYKTVDLKPLVQSWVNGTKPNFGVLINTQGKQHTLIVSSEQQHVNQRPALKVTYTVPDDHCSPNQCQNGGTCLNNNTGYTCQCAPGYEGNNCQTSVDDCAPNPCQNGGACTDGLGGYTCGCAPGYSGVNCQTNIDDCAVNPCEHGGVCTDGVADYTCACPPGYGGDDCEVDINDCAGDPCQNGGACADGVNGYTCTCALGFSGVTCDTNIDDCAGNPCHNGGTCADGVNSYTCACAPGFTGDTCDTNIDECAGDPCLNGGTCVDEANDYTCECAAGYGGDNCEIDINECAVNNCQNGGQCVDLVNAYSCTCAAGFTGANCATNIDDCAPNPCQNGGTCADGVNTYTCTCTDDYTGANCDQCRIAPAPSHQWTFNDGTAGDSAGSAHGTLNGGASIASGALVLDNSATTADQNEIGQYMEAALPDATSTKTLVAWVRLADLLQHGGSALTIEDRIVDHTGSNHFDAIDYAEQVAGQWMAGSNNFDRTKAGNNGGAPETSTDAVMIAIVYSVDNSITIYRNGTVYMNPPSYVKGALLSYLGGASDAVIGLRHSECNNNCWLSGSIDEARIYPDALTACQIEALQPVPPPATGCSDGSREGFVNETQYPAIAACSGGWSIPGVRTSNTVNPACGRVSGNSSSNPSGAGCNVSDVCAAGWHVCDNAAEVATKTGGNGCTDANVDGSFFVQRQASSGFYACFDSGNLDTAQNDMWGCAGQSPLMSGLGPDFGLNRPCGLLTSFTFDGCSLLAAPWSCNVGGASSFIEAALVTKSGSDGGGVLCCAN